MEIILLFIFGFFSFSLVITTVLKDRRDYIEWENSLYKKREN
jgi:hypothetical protein